MEPSKDQISIVSSYTMQEPPFRYTREERRKRTNEIYRYEHSRIVKEFKEACRPDPEGLVYTCIPSRGDLTHFFVFLESMVQQGPQWSSEHVVLIGINSHELDHEAYERYQKHKGDPSALTIDEKTRSSAYEENVLEKCVIDAIAEGKENNGDEIEHILAKVESTFHSNKRALTDHQRSVIEMAIQKKVRLESVSITHKHVRREDNVSVPPWVRNILGHIVQERSKGGHVLIDYIDADCFFSRGYSKAMIDLARLHPDIIVKRLMTYPAIETPPKIVNVPEKYMMPTVLKYLQTAAYNSQFFSRTDQTVLPPDVFETSTPYAPSIAVSTDSFKKNGGYNYFNVAQNGDFLFGHEIDEIVKKDKGLVQFLINPIYMSDRQGLVDGIARGETSVTETSIESLIEELFVNEYSRIIHTLGAGHRLNIYMTKKYGEKYTKQYKKELRNVKLQQEHRRHEIQDIIAFGANIYLGANKEEFFRLVKHEFGQRAEDFAQRNSVLLSTLYDVFDLIQNDPHLKEALSYEGQSTLGERAFSFYEKFAPSLAGEITFKDTDTIDMNQLESTVNDLALNAGTLYSGNYIVSQMTLIKSILVELDKIPSPAVARAAVSAAWVVSASESNKQNLLTFRRRTSS